MMRAGWRVSLVGGLFCLCLTVAAGITSTLIALMLTEEIGGRLITDNVHVGDEAPALMVTLSSDTERDRFVHT